MTGLHGEETTRRRERGHTKKGHTQRGDTRKGDYRKRRLYRKKTTPEGDYTKSGLHGEGRGDT